MSDLIGFLIGLAILPVGLWVLVCGIREGWRRRAVRSGDCTFYEAMYTDAKEPPMPTCSIDECRHPGVPLWSLTPAMPEVQQMRRDLRLAPATVLCDMHREVAMALWRLGKWEHKE